MGGTRDYETTQGNLAGYDANTVEPTGDFEALPPGEYNAVIVESTMKPTKAGDGEYLELVLEVIDGDFQNRKLWARLNLKNPSEKAVQIARGQLSAICRAVGVMTPRDSTELHDKPLAVKVTQREYEGTMTNEVKAFMAVAVTAPAPVPPPAAPAPWKGRKK